MVRDRGHGWPWLRHLIGPGLFWVLSMILIAGCGAIGYQLATKLQMDANAELLLQ